jgi:hypothetical protein
MKSVLLALCLITSSAFAQTRTPALTQYMEQLDCTTQKAVDLEIAGKPRQNAIATAAEACVSLQFKPELQGLSPSLLASTRSERVTALTSSASLRLTLCKDQGLVGGQCTAMFSPTVVETIRDAVP